MKLYDIVNQKVVVDLEGVSPYQMTMIRALELAKAQGASTGEGALNGCPVENIVFVA